MAQLSSKDEKAKKITSPEQMNDYIKTSNPAAWLTISATLILLVSIFVWGFLGSLDVTVKAGGIACDDTVVCYLPDYENIKVGSRVKAGDISGEVVSVSEKPVSRNDISAALDADEYTLYCLALADWNYIIEISIPENEADGYIEVDIVKETIKPISFLW